MSDVPLDQVLRTAERLECDDVLVRQITRRHRRFSMQDGVVGGHEQMTRGVAITVSHGGHLSFTNTTELGRLALEKTTAAAVEAAEAASLFQERAPLLFPESVARQEHSTAFEQDPAELSARLPSGLLRNLDGWLRSAPSICATAGVLSIADEFERIVTMAGADVTLRRVNVVLQAAVTACSDDLQCHRTLTAGGRGGWEILNVDSLTEQARTCGQDADAGVAGELQEAGPWSVLMTPDLVARLIFHTLLVTGASPGTPVATRIVNVLSDPRMEGGLSARALDPFAREHPNQASLVSDGEWQGLQMVWTARGLEQPRQTIPDLFMESGDSSFVEQLRANEGGLMLAGVESLQIGSNGTLLLRPQVARKVADAELGAALTNPVLETTVEELWNNCASLGDESTRESLPVSDGRQWRTISAPLVRFSNQPVEARTPVGAQPT